MIIGKLKNILTAFRTLEAISKAVDGINMLELQAVELHRETERVLRAAEDRVDRLRREEEALVLRLNRLREEIASAEAGLGRQITD